jgi:hypothetical protein
MAVERKEGTKHTVVVMLVRAVGGAPLWKESAVLCIVGSRAPARDGFEVCGGNVAGYIANNIQQVTVGVRERESRIATRRKPSRESGIHTFLDDRQLVSASCSVLARIQVDQRSLLGLPIGRLSLTRQMFLMGVPLRYLGWYL